MPFGIQIACKGRAGLGSRIRMLLWAALRLLDIALCAFGVLLAFSAKSTMGGVSMAADGKTPVEYKAMWAIALASYVVGWL